jgi:hypothetical protein
MLNPLPSALSLAVANPAAASVAQDIEVLPPQDRPRPQESVVAILDGVEPIREL